MDTINHIVGFSNLIIGHNRLLIQVEFIGPIKAYDLIAVVSNVASDGQTAVKAIPYPPVESHFDALILQNTNVALQRREARTGSNRHIQERLIGATVIPIHIQRDSFPQLYVHADV